ncbi:MAG: trigger factor [Pseudomonadota bacterium]
MQVTETKAEGLRREYTLVVSAQDLEAKTNEKLETVRADFQMKGFRKGKAPLPLLKKMFGKSVLGEVVQEAVDGAVSDHLNQAGHRPAGQPDIKITNESFDEGDDLTVELGYDCLPEVPDIDFSTIKLERKTVEVADADIEEGLGKLAESAVSYVARPEGEAAADGDQVVIDFEGSVGGEVFEGGTAEDYPLVLGSNAFIPGFEEQLTGAKAGDDVSVNVTFPENYGAANLAGQEAVFACKVKEVRQPQPAEIDDELAKRFEAEDLDDLKQKMRDQIAMEFAGAGRNLLKRRLLDALDETVSFDLPPTLVQTEAKEIAQQLWHEENPSAEGQEQPEIEPDESHTKLAERRVRLGLLLAEVGQRQGVEINEQELGQAVMAEARNFPGREREFFDFVKQNPPALERIRAPLFEEKVVDVILASADVTDVQVSKDDLQAEMDALEEEA